jgi:hypothetical protein
MVVAVFAVVNVPLMTVFMMTMMNFVMFARVLVVVVNRVFRIGFLQVIVTHLLQGNRATVYTL